MQVKRPRDKILNTDRWRQKTSLEGLLVGARFTPLWDHSPSISVALIPFQPQCYLWVNVELVGCLRCWEGFPWVVPSGFPRKSKFDFSDLLWFNLICSDLNLLSYSVPLWLETWSEEGAYTDYLSNQSTPTAVTKASQICILNIEKQ